MGHTPKGCHTIVPNIVVDRADALIDYLKRAFGAQEKLRLTLPDDTIVHCEMRIGDSQINLGASMEGWTPHPLLAQIYVEDSDAVFERAIQAGGTELMPVTDMFFGTREGRVRDPFGNTWTISTMKEEVSGEEMQRRINQQAG